MLFTRRGLERAGFQGWRPFSDIHSSRDCPTSGGVYVVVRTGTDQCTVMATSCGGWFKQQDPTVSPDALAANWVTNAECLYIGKANNLHRRLKQFASFGAGKPIGHWGGRLIWQLADHPRLLVAWKETPDRDPLAVEAELIRTFREAYGKPPFANEPHKLGR
ncbi:hypothetical protein B2G71_20880 [Novosphingobium sp. PC22D]|uniref:GIY-YIG nuclease family protein n=1 Tax=Novosphingobium sp. PC22D TaxID=1962403 RepID=UPI000BF0AEAA|nr:GIY-YIG nuclease family protein [Novosphingobium sp. PC22D]PEQ10761.1 hypothetical protein B2G71_20880 [Novosphingobium sp. PC22D]